MKEPVHERELMLPPVADTAIEVRGLRKSYGSVTALDGVDLTIQLGEVVALLGPNGAGKTTTVEILEGYRSRDEGTVQVLGEDPARRPRRLRQRIGIVLQSTGIEPYLTVEEVIDMYRGYFPSPRPLGDLLDLTGLVEQRSKLVNKLSGGQQRRLDVAVGLAGDPDLLFLDEPTTGFDPVARRAAWRMVKELASLGKTVLLTTHYMDEAEELADRVALIVRGRIVGEGTVRELVESAGARTAPAVRFRLPVGAPKPPKRVIGDATPIDGAWSVSRARPTKLLNELSTWALGKGIELEDVRVTKPSLEDVYLELTRESE